MTLTERIFALRGVPGFNQLRDEELLAVAASMTERRYRPGAVILPAGGAAWHLLIVTAGGICTAGAALPAVVGADLLLTNRPSGRTLVADPRDGAVCLRMSKGHFFTAINECPALLVDLIPIYAAAAGGTDRQ